MWGIIQEMGIGTSRERVGRRISACLCMLAMVFLYAPVAGAAWGARAMACCVGDLCPIKTHHHKAPAAPAHDMNCGHDMGAMSDCAMNCCQKTERQAISGIAFVMPLAVSQTGLAAVVAEIRTEETKVFPRLAEPLSPPPRSAVAVL